MAKDAKYLAIVEKAGGNFIPLVVKSFGIWTPFALSILHSIADRITTHSGISSKVARKNLLQQLSVSLWTNNACMILRYWALQGCNDDFPFPCSCSFFVVPLSP